MVRVLVENGLHRSWRTFVGMILHPIDHDYCPRTSWCQWTDVFPIRDMFNCDRAVGGWRTGARASRAMQVTIRLLYHQHFIPKVQ